MFNNINHKNIISFLPRYARRNIGQLLDRRRLAPPKTQFSGAWETNLFGRWPNLPTVTKLPKITKMAQTDQKKMAELAPAKAIHGWPKNVKNVKKDLFDPSQGCKVGNSTRCGPCLRGCQAEEPEECNRGSPTPQPPPPDAGAGTPSPASLPAAGPGPAPWPPSSAGPPAGLPCFQCSVKPPPPPDTSNPMAAFRLTPGRFLTTPSWGGSILVAEKNAAGWLDPPVRSNCLTPKHKQPLPIFRQPNIFCG